MHVSRLVFNNKGIYENWNNYVEEHPDKTPHHRAEFLIIINEAFGHDCFGFIAKDGIGNIVGILPIVQIQSYIFGNYATSIPFFNYGGILASSDEAKKSILNAIKTFAIENKLSSFQLRQTNRIVNEQLTINQDKVCMILELPKDMKQIGEGNAKKRAKLRSQAHLAVRKSAEMGISVSQSFGHLDLLDDYYKVFALHMRDLGTPVYSKFFLRTALNILGERATLTVVYWGRKPVGCGFLIQFDDYMEIPWASTLREANHVSMNTHMYWNIFNHALSRGIKRFDLGRSSRDSGTYKFKKQWGAEPKQCYWHSWAPKGGVPANLSPTNSKFSVAIKLWKRLPVWLTRIIGPPIFKRLP